MSFFANELQYSLKRLCRAIQCFSTVAFVIFIAFVYFTSTGTQWKHVLVPVPPRAVCSSNMFPTRDGCVPCPRGEFSFPGWSECTPWLNCTEIFLQVHRKKRFRSHTKRVWKADWKGYQVVYVECSTRPARRPNACVRGMSTMEQIQGKFASRLMGWCPDDKQVNNHRSSAVFNRLACLAGVKRGGKGKGERERKKRGAGVSLPSPSPSPSFRFPRFPFPFPYAYYAGYNRLPKSYTVESHLTVTLPRGGGGGGELKSVLYGEALPRGPNPYPFI